MTANQAQNQMLRLRNWFSKLVENVVGGNMDGQSVDSIEDTPLERTLCAAWDLASIDEYSVAMLMNNIQIAILKVWYQATCILSL
jgi:hypothetical protein